MNVSLETVLRCLDLVPIVRENQGIKLADLSRLTSIEEDIIADQLIPMLMLCGSPPYLPHDYVSIWLEGDSVYVSFGDQFKRPVTLLPMEITALHLALTTTSLPGDHLPSVRRRIDELKEKIERALPKEQRVFLDHRRRVSIDDHPDRDSPHLHLLKGAIAEKRQAEIDYVSFGESRPKTRIIHPYGIVVKDGTSYVLAHDERRGHVVSFRLDRMSAIRLRDERFTIEPGFSLENAAKGGLFQRPNDEFEVVIRVVGQTARFLAETIDARQWKWRDDETLEVRLPTSRPLAAVRWVLSLGPAAVIEAPAEACRIAAEEIAAIRRHYSRAT